MINTIDITSVRLIKKILAEHMNGANDRLFSPLFHGTDLSIIRLTNTELKIINSACEIIVRRLYSIYRDNGITFTDKRLISSRDAYGSISDAFHRVEARVNNSRLYQYGDYYLSNNPKRAIGFSSISWILGETGWSAKRMINGMKILGIQMPKDEEFRQALDCVNRRMYASKSPVVLVLTDVPMEDIYQEGKIDPLDSNMDYALLLKSNIQGMHNYYIKDILKYEGHIYCIQECNFDDLIKIWNSMSL